ncbi:phosphatidylserine/phosphatidylglycerophosphate/cardiolipin synthase family protein [Telmatospirillum sp. J64-1]|uniref:phospholipase D-like domain-containing protein n=1 Tax=Telmatospirillum sp. J64-1 TaxID=2502183 RepID=UPI00115DA70B|nr:phospholipase D-like domain-containing protein [Telmatospirillum sp. J64-1]
MDRRKRRTEAILAGGILAALSASFLYHALRPEQRKLTYLLDHQAGVDDPEFHRTVNTLFGLGLSDGHRLQTLKNGDEIFPAMLSAIAAAEQSINFETYIYWSGSIAWTFAKALAERARAGIKVKVLLDWAGSVPMKQELIDHMRKSGVQVARFRQPHWYSLDRMNNRTHRKLMIVDGELGFTGGVGIADKWLGDARGPEEWRDNHYRIEGPAVAQMQSAFADHWLEETGELLRGPLYFPQLEKCGPIPAQLVRNAPYRGSQSMHLVFMLAISAARRHIRISAAYFVPDDLTIAHLLAARRRGVEVDIIVPGRHIDKSYVREASRRLWGPLLEAGVRIYEFTPSMYHCKLLIIDESWSSIGSSNFDERSFRLNDEANLIVYDHAFARDQITLFEADKRRSREYNFHQWRRRPWTEKASEEAWNLLRAHL